MPLLTWVTWFLLESVDGRDGLDAAQGGCRFRAVYLLAGGGNNAIRFHSKTKVRGFAIGKRR